ncbi:MAG: ATP-binding cassette domain-containing protein, partial [Chroococcidiopsidaceae cyanobacterium CP_BM_ER_R8_30]|nr:ATP-binding cassette domain-containing protein [Chroococcidiopsidaceae cyanobacterium CP_BM_ER_R8_30]
MRRILEVRNLSKIYGKVCPHCVKATGPQANTNICSYCHSLVAALDISFDLNQGEILGIMGESGSGKSTLVKLLYFDQTPTSGSAKFFDIDKSWDLFTLNAAQQRWLRDRKFGMVYQNPHSGLNFRVSAGGNIAERLLMSGCLSYDEIRDRASNILAHTEFLTERIDELPGNFSGGMQQRVQIARALAPRPPLLFLDEVTTGLDLSIQ